MKKTLLSVFLCFLTSVTLAAPPRCEAVFLSGEEKVLIKDQYFSIPEASQILQTPRELKKVIRKTVQNRLRQLPIWQRFSPRQRLLFEKAMTLQLETLFIESSPQWGAYKMWTSKKSWGFLTMKALDSEMLSLLQNSSFEKFYQVYQQRYGTLAAVRVSANLVSKVTSLVVLSSLSLALFWYFQSLDEMNDTLTFDMNLSDADEALLSSILDQGVFKSPSEIAEALRQHAPQDAEWNGFISNLETEILK